MSRNRIEQHPDEFRDDLNPNYRQGQNDGTTRDRTRTAHDIKDAHRRLSEMRDDELKQIPILEDGERLEQRAVYFDLKHPERGEIQARADMVAGPENWYVPKSQVDYQLWNLLVGVDDWDRLGTLVDEGDERTTDDPALRTHGTA